MYSQLYILERKMEFAEIVISKSNLGRNLAKKTAVDA